MNNIIEQLIPFLPSKAIARVESLLGVFSGEEFENDGEEISLEDAKKIAIDFMFKLFPDANERFRLEVLEEFDSEEEFEDNLHSRQRLAT